MRVLQFPAPAIEGLQANWSFTPGRHPLWHRLRNSRIFYSEPAPAFEVITAPVPRDRWVAAFIFAPAGSVNAAQLFTLRRLRDLGTPLFVVYASPTKEIPAEILACSDALCWKSLRGYDFSAYTIALRLIARHSPHANVFIMNDSMFGPFSDFRPVMDNAPWEFTGFTASGLCGNHVQSYAFMMRDVTLERMDALSRVFNEHRATNREPSVIFNQELKMADIASRTMSVGACWYGDGKLVDDPCLRKPFELIAAGFPFMKKSLLGKRSFLQPRDRSLAQLQTLGHPLDGFS